MIPGTELELGWAMLALFLVMGLTIFSDFLEIYVNKFLDTMERKSNDKKEN